MFYRDTFAPLPGFESAFIDAEKIETVLGVISLDLAEMSKKQDEGEDDKDDAVGAYDPYGGGGYGNDYGDDDYGGGMFGGGGGGGGGHMMSSKKKDKEKPKSPEY